MIVGRHLLRTVEIFMMAGLLTVLSLEGLLLGTSLMGSNMESFRASSPQEECIEKRVWA